MHSEYNQVFAQYYANSKAKPRIKSGATGRMAAWPSDLSKAAFPERDNISDIRKWAYQIEGDGLLASFPARSHPCGPVDDRGRDRHDCRVDMITGKIEVVYPSDVEWSEALIEQIGRPFFIKPLLNERETGMGVAMLRYPAGFTNPHHTHPCGHGMYVLEGKLVTHRGEFGPGTFVWFPEGEPMQHGASADEDMVALFITNKPFSIDYIMGDSDQ